MGNFYYKTFLYFIIIFDAIHVTLLNDEMVKGERDDDGKNGIEIRNHVQRWKKSIIKILMRFEWERKWGAASRIWKRT